MMKYLLQEKKQHGDSIFPISLYDVSHVHTSCPVLPCHWHEEYEIIYIEKGSAEFNIGGSSYVVHAGQTIFVNGSQLHCAQSMHSGGCDYHAIVFHLSLLSSSLNDLCQSQYISPLLLKQYQLPALISDDQALGERINVLVIGIIDKLTLKTPGYELFVKGSLMMVLALLKEYGLLILSDEQLSVHRRNKDEKIRKIIDYISFHYQEKILIDDLAAIAETNRYNISRFFKATIGMTPIEYLNLYRVDVACKLLVQGSYNITEVALQVGFDNMSYFSKIFKKFKGITPTEFITTG